MNEQGKLYYEDVKEYTIAMPVDSEELKTKLNSIAKALLLSAKQEAIYVRHADGSVEFIN
jgi:hypothetical protein